MAAIHPALALLVSLAALDPSAAAAPRDAVHADSLGADSVQAKPRIVRRFPPIEVWGTTLHDPRSSETVHLIAPTAMRVFPVDGLADVLALQAGVVAQGEELHVRGGRAGETRGYLDGMGLNDPRSGKSMELPLLALRGVDLVSGSPEAQYGAGLAGALELHGLAPTEKPSFAWRWESALFDRWYDRWAARVSSPLRVLGLGIAAAGDITLDNGALPDLRTPKRERLLGVPFQLRIDDRQLGWVRIAPVEQPQRYSLQVLSSRTQHRPYDPTWSAVIADQGSGTPGTPGYIPPRILYNAADHLDVTDERRTAAVLSLARLRERGRVGLTLGWMRTRAVTSLTGERYRNVPFIAAGYTPQDSFHVQSGDDPLYRESGSELLTARLDGEASDRRGRSLKVGLGATYEDVTEYELDRTALASVVAPLREYHAWAPGGWGYVQGRWEVGGFVLNIGMRTEHWTPGAAAREQSLPGDDRGIWTWSPRLGFAFPVSTRDAFAFSYARIHQAPDRDFLYDNRSVNTNRQPLGNPELTPSTVISYEGSLKHTYTSAWALQFSVFYRDVYGQVGMRNRLLNGQAYGLQFTSEDDAQAAGAEWSLLNARGARRRAELRYTFMHAWGLESRPEGDPYGTVLGARLTPIAVTPLSWDRRHSLTFAATWPWHDDWQFSWTTAVGSPLPWTPKRRREEFLDLGLLNSRRLEWAELTNLNVQWTPPFTHGVTVGLEARNLFDHRGERTVTVDGYPNPVINTLYDDYGAYRTETGLGGGAYWSTSGAGGRWIPVHDARLLETPRSFRLSVGADW